MPNTGEKKYDELPGRIGWTDVDALRAGYLIAKKRYLECKIRLNKIRIQYLKNKKLKEHETKEAEKLKLCKNCHCMTHTKKGYVYICGKCGKDRRGNKP